ncbi:hypothetical protein QYE76_013361 [Lolium multiflorum]|uniref:MBD domain-containing protein n=1 Tax=Lolium multiflorum TaxID=4521 RepID=A0AAD8X7J0_LOLMU|nr:hypothetical protein QYE76_013361 [Lolium multiflorum]
MGIAGKGLAPAACRCAPVSMSRRREDAHIHRALQPPGSKRPDCSCEDPADVEYDSSRIWVIDKPNIPKPPPKTERLAIMRGDLTKMDIYYVLPNGKRARTLGDVQKFVDTNPEYKDSLSAESFSFTVPKIVDETVSHSSARKTKKAKKEDKTIASSSKN